MGVYTGLAIAATVLVVGSVYEWQRKKRDRRMKFLRNLREVLGPQAN
jgi:hypothetical protein